MRIDLHTHSSVSDGTDSPSELVANALTAGVDVVGLCDHDTFAGLAAAGAAGRQLGVRVLNGIEISTEHQGTSVHLLGYGTRTDDPALNAELARIREGRTGRIPAMLAKLEQLGMPIPAEALAAQVGSSPSVGRPHLADAMIELGYVHDRREAFDTWLAEDQPVFVPRYAADLRTALQLVRSAGGVGVLAHPWGRISRDELPAELIGELFTAGLLDGIEIDHQDHDAQTRAVLRGFASESGLLITGSSDYHGTGKVNHDLGCNTTDPEMLARIETLVGERGGNLDAAGC